MLQRKNDTSLIYLFADPQMFLSKVHGLVMVPKCSVSISKTPACTSLPNPAFQNMCGDKVKIKQTSARILREYVCLCVYLSLRSWAMMRCLRW